MVTLKSRIIIMNSMNLGVYGVRSRNGKNSTPRGYPPESLYVIFLYPIVKIGPSGAVAVCDEFFGRTIG